jgi:hypothetical protein
MFKSAVTRSRAGVLLGSLVVAGLVSCSADPATPTTTSKGGSAGSGGSTTSAGGSSTGGSGAGGSGMGGSSTAGSGGSAGSAGTAGTAGTAGAGGSGGSAGATGLDASVSDATASDAVSDASVSRDGGDADVLSPEGGACAPGPRPEAGTAYSRTGWLGAWGIPCNFTTYGGCTEAMPPEKAFDTMLYATRTSLGDTNLAVTDAGPVTAQRVGDTFTIDMRACNEISRIVFWAGAGPPTFSGAPNYDTRDYPGALEATVSTDCTSPTTGTYGAVVGTGMEPQPGCSGGANCNMPFTVTFTQPTAARCVKLRLTRILQLGGGIWWAITDLNAFP